MNYLPRGFTGHEHLPKFNLINMNGRVYDPLLSMFISPDKYLQAPGMSQNYNRYAYCFNNPLSFTDPTGNFGVAGAIIGGLLGGYQGYQIASSKGYSMNSIEMAAYINGGSLIGSAAGFFGASGGIIGAGAGGATSGGGFAALNGGDAADIAGGMATGWVVGAASYAAAQGIVYGVGAVIDYMPIIPAGTTYGQKWVWDGTNDHWISLGNYLNLSSNAVSQTAGYAGTGGVMWANAYMASYNGSSSYFDRSTVIYACAGGGGEWGDISIWERLYNDLIIGVTEIDGIPVSAGTIPTPGIGKIGSYSQLAKMTRGYKGAIQAHHLVEVRHLKGLLMSSKNAPSVILSKADHAALTKTLRDLLPYGEAYTKPQIINAYKTAYSNFPEWVNLVVKFLQ